MLSANTMGKFSNHNKSTLKKGSSRITSADLEQNNEATIQHLEATLATAAQTLISRDACILDFETRLEHHAHEIFERDKSIADLETTIASRDAIILDLERRLLDQARTIDSREEVIAALNARLHPIVDVEERRPEDRLQSKHGKNKRNEGAMSSTNTVDHRSFLRFSFKAGNCDNEFYLNLDRFLEII